MTPTPGQADWRRYILWAGIWVSFIAALGYAASDGGLGFLENDVSLSLEANRDSVPLSRQEPAVIQVKVTLRNNTSKAVTLKAPSACKMFRWQIFNRSGEMVQSKTANEEICPGTEVSAILPPGQKLEEFYSIALVARRYTPGQDYLVQARYWGYEGEFQFKAD